MSVCTCHTEGCPNRDVPLQMQLTFVDDVTGETYAVAAVVCGPCGQPITDITGPDQP